jgi:LysM repeat protein
LFPSHDQVGETVTVQEGDSLSKIAADTGTTVEELLAANPSITDPNLIQAGQTINVPSGSGFNLRNFFSGLGDGKPGFSFGDILAGGGKIFDFLGKAREGIQGATGIDPAYAALAAAYAKATERAAKKEVGGMRDIRESIRPDLKQTPYSLGFDLGLPQYAEGGEVLDMRDGGESVGPGTGTSDDIPAMLSDGEFVMTAKANMGAGAVKINKKKGGIMEIVPSLEPDRQRGADNMMKLMKYFEGVA